MDSRTEINNDTRFEHFIDESLDIDMSACAPILNAGTASFFDEILNTATAPLVPIGAATAATAAGNRMHQAQITHDFLVRLSPVAAGKRASPSPGVVVPRVMPAAIKTVRLFGMEQTGTPAPLEQNIVATNVAPAATIKTESTSGAHAFLVPPGRNSMKGAAAVVTPPKVTTTTTTTTKTPAPAARTAAPKKPAVIEFFCHQCDLRVKSHVEFEKHYRIDHPGTPTTYACSLCPNKHFGNLQSYRTHVKRHGERHPCAVCTRKFLTAELLAEHGQTHTSELRLMCGHCQQEFDDFGKYCQHVRVHRRPPATKPVKWKCPVCGKLFKNRAGLNTHAKVHRDGTAIDLTATDVTPVEAQAAPATITTTNSSTVRPPPVITVTAMPVVVSQQPLQQVPPKVAADKPPITTTTTTAIATAAAVVLDFTCDVCDKSFASRTQLLRHRDHHNERSFKCETCQKFYKTERDLKVHSLVHYEQRPHACTHCGKSFLSSSKLKQHSNVHTGERPFKCKYCDKDFTNFPNWLKHVRRSHKVDHKTGEQLEQLPNFLVREKKGSVASIAARAKKEAAAAAAATAAAAAASAGNGSTTTAVATMTTTTAKPKSTAAAARKSKAAAQQSSSLTKAPSALAPPPPSGLTLISIKQEYIVPEDSALDLHDTNATGPTATAASTTTAAAVYQDEASLPLDLRGMSASIQLQQSIDVHDMHQMQLLIPSHDESFASIEDVPTTELHGQHSLLARKPSPTTQAAAAAALSRTGGGGKSAQTSPSGATLFTPKIKVEPGRFSFARAAAAVDCNASSPTGQSVSFLTLLGQPPTSGEAAANSAPPSVTTTSNGGTAIAGAKKAQQLSPLGNVPRRHFGGVATSHMFATNVL